MSRTAAINEDSFLTPPQCARLLKVDPHTVASWIKSGELIASDLARKGSRRPRWRVARCDLELFLASRRPTPPPPRVPRRRRTQDYTTWV